MTADFPDCGSLIGLPKVHDCISAPRPPGFAALWRAVRNDVARISPRSLAASGSPSAHGNVLGQLLPVIFEQSRSNHRCPDWRRVLTISGLACSARIVLRALTANQCEQSASANWLKQTVSGVFR
jgi:hypothetical protein